MSERRGRLEYGAALGLLVAGGALCLVSAGRSWGAATVDDGLSTTVEHVTGRDLFPLASAVALLALAAVVAIPATRRGGRRLVGAVLAVAGIATAVGAYGLARGLPERVVAWAERTGGTTGSVTGVTTESHWALLTGLGSLLIAAAGVAVTLRGSGWTGMGRRYERDPGRPAVSTDTSQPAASRDAWDALDRGDDPTS